MPVLTEPVQQLHSVNDPVLFLFDSFLLFLTLYFSSCSLKKNLSGLFGIYSQIAKGLTFENQEKREKAFGFASRNGWSSFKLSGFQKPSLTWPEDMSQASRYYSLALLAMLLLAQPIRFQPTVATAESHFPSFLGSSVLLGL